MVIVKILLEMIGGLAIFMYGMQMASDGMQRAAGDRMQRTLNFMTGNRFLSILTGFIITVLVQSSSASTVMIVSFVNAGLINLVQAVGCIMGANIGTTVTGWLISLVGVKFSIKAFAVPIIALGFFLTLSKKRKSLNGWGSALMGFGFIFLGLELLAASVPTPGKDALLFLAKFTNLGILTTIICVIVGAIFTALVNASSAAQAIIITLAMQGVLTYEMAVGLMLGANIGTCTDALLVSFGTNTAAKRAAWAHLLFNVFGAVWAVALFGPFLRLIDFVTPGEASKNIALHIAMMHTTFNSINTLIILPFVRQYAGFLTWLIKPSKAEAEGPYRFPYINTGIHDTPGLGILQARGEIAKMTRLTRDMFHAVQSTFGDDDVSVAGRMEELKAMENRADEMREELSRYLASSLGEAALSEADRTSATTLMRIVEDLENITDLCYHLAMLLDKAETKHYAFDKKEIERLRPYVRLVDESLAFFECHIDKETTPDELEEAHRLEEEIDSFKANLKKSARKRLESGGDVRSELLYIDIVRNIEKIGDYAYSISLGFAGVR
ncbi:MAG TPA: Na/Pi cotransporter family protein [Spirochaetales bacterium]|nr:Na/Pi cotransporter family protein [Spirochaetales bacterium]